MQHRRIPVACIQARAHDRDAFDTAWPHVLARVDEAGRRGARLIVLPEGTVPGYVLGAASVPSEQIARALDDLAALARTHAATIVCGVARTIAGTTYNAAVAIGPTGDELGFAAKQFLWHFDRRWFAPGETLDPIETPIGTLGILVCADGRIPTIAATLVERGAQILVMPTAWVTSGRDPASLENIQADLMANVRARENAVPFVVANKSGFECASVAYCGKSAIVDASGAFVARASESEDEILMGEIALPTPGTQPRDAVDFAAGAYDSEHVARVARVAFTIASDAHEIASLRARASEADATCFISLADIALRARAGETVAVVDGVRFAIVRSQTIRHPRGLVAARLGGVDAVVWLVDEPDSAWDVRIARTRAAELRAFVVVLDATNDRAYAVDPDGVVVSGTFAGLRLGAFVYDPARAAASIVAPSTDVLAGLRTAEAIRSRALAEAARAR